MPQAGSLACVAIGALLLGVLTRITIPPLAWVALALLLHGSRSMPFGSGAASVCLALFVGLAIGERGILPMAGPAYFAVVARSPSPRRSRLSSTGWPRRGSATSA